MKAPARILLIGGAIATLVLSYRLSLSDGIGEVVEPQQPADETAVIADPNIAEVDRSSVTPKIILSESIKASSAVLRDAVTSIVGEYQLHRPEQEFARDLAWMDYEKGITELLQWSEVDPRIKSYPFLDRDYAAGLSQEEDLFFLNTLCLEVWHLRDGLFTEYEDTDRDQRFCLGILSSNGIYDLPVSQILSMPVFGEIDDELIIAKLQELQNIRWEFLLRYLPLLEQSRALKYLRSGEHPVFKDGWEGVVAPAHAELDLEFQAIRTEYAKALALAVGGKEFPVL